jgi:nicotinate-nucleotide pyrophosphorylase (carboxylating)
MSTPSPPHSELSRDVKRALAEDVGSGDRTAALIAEDRHGRATVITREAAVLCGRPWFDEVFHQLDPGIVVTWQADEGGSLEPGQLICGLEGHARALLTGERTALNFLQTLSGTATVTRQYVAAIAGLPCQILDTRKTIPGLRRAQKYAVRCGGGRNHRLGLFDGILVKENHIVAAGSILAAVHAAKRQRTRIPIEVEVESLDELRQALDAGADMALLDEFSLDDLRTAVELSRAHDNGPIKLEASGGVSLESLRAIAGTGVDFISVGALTKNLRAVDLSMRFQFD